MNPEAVRVERDRRTVMWFAGLGVFWAMLQAVPYLAPVVMLTNGLAFATYGAVMYAVRRDRWSSICAVVIAVLGLSHTIWLSPFMRITEYFGLDLVLGIYAAMLLSTGIVLGIALCVCSRRLWMAIPIAIGIALSVAAASYSGPGGIFIYPVGAPTTLLHLGLLGALVPDTLSRLRVGRLPVADVKRACPTCGAALLSVD